MESGDKGDEFDEGAESGEGFEGDGGRVVRGVNGAGLSLSPAFAYDGDGEVVRMAIDWKVLENEYVTTSISLRDLAEKYGAVMMTVGRHCKKGEWARKRDEYVDNVKTKCTQILADHDIVSILSQRQKILEGYADIMTAYQNAARKLAMTPDPEMRDVNEGLKAVANSHAADALFFGTGEDNRIILELDPELDEYAK